MTLNEAKDVFFKYGGLDYYIFREEPELYREYKELDISDETKELWRQELIDILFDNLHNSNQPQWSVLQSLIGLLHETRSNQCENCGKLLKALLGVKIDSEKEVELITKILAGGTYDYSDGAVKFICEHSSLIHDFEKFVCKINNITSIEEALNDNQIILDENRRYALDSFRKAVAKYSKGETLHISCFMPKKKQTKQGFFWKKHR